MVPRLQLHSRSRHHQPRFKLRRRGRMPSGNYTTAEARDAGRRRARDAAARQHHNNRQQSTRRCRLPGARGSTHASHARTRTRSHSQSQDHTCRHAGCADFGCTVCTAGACWRGSFAALRVQWYMRVRWCVARAATPLRRRRTAAATSSRWLSAPAACGVLPGVLACAGCRARPHPR
jgi:hypothetical protein